MTAMNKAVATDSGGKSVGRRMIVTPLKLQGIAWIDINEIFDCLCHLLPIKNRG